MTHISTSFPLRCLDKTCHNPRKRCGSVESHLLASKLSHAHDPSYCKHRLRKSVGLLAATLLTEASFTSYRREPLVSVITLVHYKLQA